jgi:ABC-type glutathione transport system ATPase component
MTSAPGSASASAPPALELRDVDAAYAPGAPLVLHGVSLRVERGSCLALIGESGSGKSTAARLWLGLLAPTRGEVFRFGVAVPRTLRMAPAERRRVQPVFQHPAAALDPLFDAEETLHEALAALRPDVPAADRPARIRRLCEETGLPLSCLPRRTTRLSGGEQQRLCIARALAAEPEALVLDEPTSALDLALQAKIAALLDRLRRERGLAYVLVTHDLRLAARLADRGAVLRRGAVVEEGPAAALLANPSASYTRRLVAAIPPFDPEEARAFLSADDLADPDDAETGSAAP